MQISLLAPRSFEFRGWAIGKTTCLLTSRSLFGSTACCHAGSKYSWGCSSTRHTANTSRGRASRPPSWCIDHKSVASTSHNWRSLRDLLKLMPVIYDGVQVATRHSSVSSERSSAAGWWASDWFAPSHQIRPRCPQSNCWPADGSTSCCSDCCSSRWRLSFAVAERWCISCRWELQQVERGERGRETECKYQ